MPVRILSINSSDTGTFGPVDFGDQYRFASYADNSTGADADVGGTVEGTIGAAGMWTTILTLTTNSSGTMFSSTGTDLPAFDKLRVVLTANNSTGDTIAWLGAGD
jgi:hypothetical protein